MTQQDPIILINAHNIKILQDIAEDLATWDPYEDGNIWTEEEGWEDYEDE